MSERKRTGDRHQVRGRSIAGEYDLLLGNGCIRVDGDDSGNFAAVERVDADWDLARGANCNGAAAFAWNKRWIARTDGTHVHRRIAAIGHKHRIGLQFVARVIRIEARRPGWRRQVEARDKRCVREIGQKSCRIYRRR